MDKKRYFEFYHIKYLKRRGKKFHFLYNWVIKNHVIITFNIFIHNKYKNTDVRNNFIYFVLLVIKSIKL
ncbi:hypothetical protein BpHYR1_030379 [Brachionus plicatilis]|uniref:Uncharacterized protein n=1 Tax=Brachionus plicatilis TaxID=10195 RepID=A0A3M7SH77_BRAPC|nr:hypothetical protein BpHYR1_030379 [Brachionus plicatilis]